MVTGELFSVNIGSCSELHYVDTGMFDTAEYGAVYLLTGERIAIIDTGIGKRPELILDALDTLGYQPADVDVIAPTHVHLDHAGGAGQLAKACPNATVYVHELGARHLIDPERLIAGTKAAVGDQWEYYGDIVPVPEDRVEECADGDVIDLGDHELRVHHMPGHAPHQVIFEDPANDAVFTADAAGIYVPGLDRVRETSPPPDFDLERCLEDIERIGELDPEVLCYAHFGPARTADRLSAYETVLSEWVGSVRRRRSRLGNDAAVIASFVEELSIDEQWGKAKAVGETKMNVRGVFQYLDDT
ncbi:MBL fold metallo-hydrolase [Halocatena halophila]|uniref:MBL fold metallo-hydrolase n=1 Tax=Halocatena halophila TaxID=2814576 RepID=UPI002ED0766D